jgi:hypothetical protein
MKKFLVPAALAAFMLAFILSACSGAGEEAVYFADTATENFLIALSSRDYESYKRDLSEEMLKAVPEEEFVKFSSYLEETAGEYIKGSKKLSTSGIQKGMDIVVYLADYTKESEKVRVTIVISKNADGDYRISGSWFDSPGIREKAYQ